MMISVYLLLFFYFFIDLQFLFYCPITTIQLLPFLAFTLLSNKHYYDKNTPFVIIISESIKQVCIYGFLPLSILWFYFWCGITAFIASKTYHFLLLPVVIMLFFTGIPFVKALYCSTNIDITFFSPCTKISFIVSLIGISVSLKWLSTVAQGNRF